LALEGLDPVVQPLPSGLVVMGRSKLAINPRQMVDEGLGNALRHAHA